MNDISKTIFYVTHEVDQFFRNNAEIQIKKYVQKKILI